jgi:hypothetical protein
LADLPTVFTESAATRIGAATRWAELQQGIPQDGYGSSPGNGLCLVRTRTTFPAGYNGAMGAPGQVIEKQPDGTVTVIGAAWIKDQNGGTLSANTIYQARIGGTWTQDVTTNGIVKPTTLGLYLVQAGGNTSASGWQLYEYRGGSLSISNLTITNLETGYNSLLVGNPLGIDATSLPTAFGVVPRIWAKTVSGLLQLYNVVPFGFWAKSSFMVDDGYGNDVVYLNSPFMGQIGSFRVKDPTRAFRANYMRYGQLPMVYVTWSPVVYPFGTPANQFPYVINAAEVVPTTGGIGSGISTGISGV